MSEKKVRKGTPKYEKIVAMVKEITDQYDMKLTLRQIYYRLVAKEVIPNKISQYKDLSAILVEARKNGDIDSDIFEDKTRTSKVKNTYLNSKKSVMEWYFGWMQDNMKYYSVDRWYKQQSKVFVVLEKQALESVFGQICSKLEITLIVNRGYNSFTQLKELADNMKRANPDLPRYFLMFGDFDPTGHDIVRNFRDQITELDIAGEYFDIAINQQQIDQYNLPPQPVKTTDSRAKKFIEDYGSGVVELDALEPHILQDLVETNVNQYFDQNIYEEAMDIQADYRAYLGKVAEKLGDRLPEILEEIENESEESDE
jgi:hypothetical protein